MRNPINVGNFGCHWQLNGFYFIWQKKGKRKANSKFKTYGGQIWPKLFLLHIYGQLAAWCVIVLGPVLLQFKHSPLAMLKYRAKKHNCFCFGESETINNWKISIYIWILWRCKMKYYKQGRTKWTQIGMCIQLDTANKTLISFLKKNSTKS